MLLAMEVSRFSSEVRFSEATPIVRTVFICYKLGTTVHFNL
jgi:hypothetical protein